MQYTKSTNTDLNKAQYGENSAGVLALQKSLNQKYSGQAGYIPLKEDGLYGDLTKGAVAGIGSKYGITPAPTTTTNPIVSSTQTSAGYDALGNEIKTLYNNSSLTKASEASTKLINDRITALDQRRAEEIAGIKADYEIAKGAQDTRQNKDYQGASTNLITSGGGFLGYTGSQGGVLQGLKETHEAEKTALMGKRDSAIAAAQSAYDDKQFALAQSLIKEAKDTEQEIYNRQKDFAAESLALAREARSAKEFDMGIADKKIEAYSSMTDAEFSKIDPIEISNLDKNYFTGYTESARKIAQQLAEGKTLENDLKLKNSIQTLINKTPAGQKIVLADGTVFVGNKKPVSIGGGSLKNTITPLLAQQIPALKGLVGQKEDDVILTLELSKPAPWFENYLKETEGDKFSQEGIKSIWETFRNDADLVAYRNTVKLNQRASVNDPLANLNISADDIAAALNEEE